MCNRIYSTVFAFVLLGGVMVFAGCGGAETADAPNGASSGGHHHEPPHGGAPVVLGDEAFHLEFVCDTTNGALRAYVLDGHMESFIRIDSAELGLVIEMDGQELPVSLAAVANPDTGETVGDTAQFEATVPELVGVDSFVGTISEIEIRGNQFNDVRFTYPEGNESKAHSH